MRLIAEILFLCLFIWFLPYLYKSSWQGIAFLVTTILYIGCTLWTLLSKRKIYQEMISYNLIMIFVFLYFALIVLRISFDTRLQMQELYTINIEYCKNNFFILALIMIGLICNTILLSFAKEEGQEKDTKKGSD